MTTTKKAEIIKALRVTLAKLEKKVEAAGGKASDRQIRDLAMVRYDLLELDPHGRG